MLKRQYAIVSHENKHVILFEYDSGHGVLRYAFSYSPDENPVDIWTRNYYTSGTKYTPIVFGNDEITVPLLITVNCSSEAYFLIMSKMLFYKKVQDTVLMNA